MGKLGPPSAVQHSDFSNLRWYLRSSCLVALVGSFTRSFGHCGDTADWNESTCSIAASIRRARLNEKQ